MKKITLVLLTALFCYMSFETSVSAASHVITVKRGSTLAWSKARYEWYYNGTKISASYGSQDSGYIFPNLVKELGITKYRETSSEHKWRSKTSYSIGSPTPWGDVDFATSTYSDYVTLKASGKYTSN